MDRTSTKYVDSAEPVVMKEENSWKDAHKVKLSGMMQAINSGFRQSEIAMSSLETCPESDLKQRRLFSDYRFMFHMVKPGSMITVIFRLMAIGFSWPSAVPYIQLIILMHLIRFHKLGFVFFVVSLFYHFFQFENPLASLLFYWEPLNLMVSMATLLSHDIVAIILNLSQYVF